MIYCVNNNGRETRYIKFGCGEKSLVILPGLSLKSVLDDAAAIENAYARFAEDYTVYLFDRVSEIPHDYTLEAMARDSYDAICASGIKSACIFGASQGGMLAMIIAAEHPEICEKLVVGSSSARSAEAISAKVSDWISLAEESRKDELTGSMIRDIFSAETVERYGEILRGMLSSAGENDLKRFALTAKACREFDIREKIKNIACPALVIGCEGDRVTPPELSRKIAELTGAELYIYPAKYGHAVYDEAPDYKERIYNFLRG